MYMRFCKLLSTRGSICISILQHMFDLPPFYAVLMHINCPNGEIIWKVVGNRGNFFTTTIPEFPKLVPILLPRRRFPAVSPLPGFTIHRPFLCHSFMWSIVTLAFVLQSIALQRGENDYKWRGSDSSSRSHAANFNHQRQWSHPP